MKFILISCGCMLLFTNMQFNCKHGDGLVLGQSLMSYVPCYYAKVSLLYYVLRFVVVYM